MPKKTKKEKIIAQYRRKLSTIRKADSPTSAPIHAEVAVQPMDHAIRRDLMKTLMLAVIAIGGEIVLSMVIGK